MNEKPIKPLILEYEEAKKEIFNTLNEIMSKKAVPLFLLENILSSALEQISLGARRERENAAIFYEKQMAEYETTEKEGEKEG